MATRLLYGFLMIAVAQIHFARGGDAPPKVEARSRLYTSQFYYTSGLLIASNEKGTAAIEVRALHDDGGLDFEYRYLPTGPDAVEVTGKGSVSPVGGNATTQPATVLPEGIAELKVGELLLLWGKGTREWGWIHYAPEKVTLQVVFSTLESLELEKFQK